MISHSAISSTKNRDYTHTQAEINTTDDIYSIKVAEDKDRIYVFYQNAAVLNVYNLNGDFQWAIAIPRERNGLADFLYNDDKISLFWYSQYDFDAITGEYIESSDDYDYDYDGMLIDYEKNEKEAEALGYHFAFCDLWHDDGRYIVDKPDYYILINPILGWAIGFGSGLMIALIALINRFKSIARYKIDKTTINTGPRLLGIILKMYFAIQITYAVSIIPVMYKYPDSSMPIGIMGIVIVFIVLGVIIANLVESKRKLLDANEKRYLQKWSGICILALALDIITMIISTL